MAQQIIPAAQLVLKCQRIGRYNKYVMLQSISCSPECKIVRKILLDHPLSYALTATTDVPVMSVTVRGMLILDAFLTEEIRATDDYKESLRINLSSDKNITQEMMDTVSLLTPTTSKDPHSKRRISRKYSHLLGALPEMCKRQGYMIKNMERKCVTENNLKLSIGETVIEDRDAFRSEEWDAWEEETVIDEDEVIPNDETPELIKEFQNVDKRAPTIFDRAKMEVTLNDMFSNQFKNAEESRVIYERVYDFQLGIESNQIKVNSTASTLIFPSVEAYDPYSIVDKQQTSLIYLNSKDDKRVMYLMDIVKFYDAMLEKVLNEVKLRIF
nr:hypothetical protein [Tanacetum cinerariifolium]